MGIKFKNVAYLYPSLEESKHALLNVDLEIASKHEFVAIVGHTGSGKSTLIQHMNALLTASGGEIEIFGENLKEIPKLTPIRQKVGMVFQFPEYQLFEETVERDIMFGPQNFGVSKEEAKQIAREVIEQVGLSTELLERSPFTLSGGQMRRVAIAGILAMHPEILVLDEPTVGLDPAGQKEMMQLFQSIHETTDKTIILVTHDMNVVAEYCSRVIVMKKGEKVFDATPLELFSQKNLLDEYNLEIPHYMQIVKSINASMKTNYNEHVLSLEDAISALKG